MDLLKQVDEYINHKRISNTFFAIYPFSNENINGYLPHFDLSGTSLLTTGSSGDQAINAALAGCDNITIYDICPLSKAFYYLKLASLLCLKREEFLSFLMPPSNSVLFQSNDAYLNLRTFNKIKNALKVLDYESAIIWEYIFNKYSAFDIERLFRIDINNLKSTVYCNNYLRNDYAYCQARKRLKNIFINFVEGDLVYPKLNQKYYNIWLSNIAEKIPAEQRIPLIENNNDHLINGGRLLMCYYWNANREVKGQKIKELENLGGETIIIPGVKNGEDNSILIYEKKLPYLK